jgi:hypothetical protein
MAGAIDFIRSLSGGLGALVLGVIREANMKTYLARYFVASLALLFSSVGLAATVTVTTSNDSPNVGDSFTLTLSVADMVNTAGPTLQLSYNNAVVSFTSMALPATGPFAATSGTFLVQHLPTFDILLATPFTGNSDFLTMTFQAIGNGDAMIQVFDDGGATTGWFDADTFEAIPTTYTQADVCVGPNCGTPIVPVPAAAWLLLSALGSVAGLKRLRRQ